MIRNPLLARSLCCVLEQNTLLLQVSLSTQVYKWFLFINDKWFEIVNWQDHYAVFLGKSLYSYKCISPHGCINDSRNCQGGLIKWWWTSIPSRGGGGVVHLILLVTSCWGNWNKLLLDRLFGSVTDFTFTTLETVDLLPYMASFSLLTGISSLFVLTLNGFKWRLWQLRKYFRNFLWLGIIP